MSAPIKTITYSELMALFNHRLAAQPIPMSANGVMTIGPLKLPDFINCPCGNNIMVQTKPWTDARIIVCPLCQDWHYVEWKHQDL